MSFLIVVTIVVLFPPLNFSVVFLQKKVPHGFSSWIFWGNHIVLPVVRFSNNYLMAFLAEYSGVIILYCQAASIFFQ